MEFLSRTRRMFQYGDLDSETRQGDNMNDPDAETAIVSANGRNRRSRRCLWVGSTIAVIAAIVIIAAVVKHRHNIKNAADSLIESFYDDMPQVIKPESQPVSSARVAGQRPYSFNDFLSVSFYPDTFNGTWISDTEILFLDQYGGLSIHNVEKTETFTVVSDDQILHLRPIDYSFSADRQYLLVKTSSQRVWRRSSFGEYVLLKASPSGRYTQTPVPLLPANAVPGDGNLLEYLRYVSWAPVGNSLAYVDYDNNIHYRRSAESEDIQLTHNGNDTYFYNGIPDWVNEEEVFEDHRAIYWSPDANFLVYGVFDDTEVTVVKLPRYGHWKDDENSVNRQGYPFLQYYMLEDFRYPKAGTVNPTVSLRVAAVGNHLPPGTESGTAVQQYTLPSPDRLPPDAHYSAVEWADNQTAAVNWMNRVQNVSVVSLCQLSLTDANCRQAFMTEERNGWVDYLFRPFFKKGAASGDHRFLAILPATDLPHPYRQLFLVDPNTNTRTALTHDQAEVTSILYWGPEDHIYYVRTGDKSPGSRHLYQLKLPGSQPICLTCNHQEMMPDEISHRPACDYVSVEISKGGSYYSMECKGPGVPYTCLHHTNTNTLVKVWTDNAFLERRYAFTDTPIVQYTEIPVPGGAADQMAQVALFLPSELSSPADAAGKKYPMLVDVYGGPGFQKVDKTWQGYGYAAYMAAAHKVVYAVIDPRGSGFQGNDWMFSVYRKFGTVEVTDTIHVAKQLQLKLPYVDSERTAIWGWSYGGFLSLSALTKDIDDIEPVFRCGASVAPVVRWELYDTLYTERYMSLPQENYEAYNRSSPLWGLDNLRHKKYLLIHGTHDDNVHFQHSMLLSAALEEKDILFRQQAYPDQDHGIGDYRTHLYHTLTNFIVGDCFGQDVSKK